MVAPLSVLVCRGCCCGTVQKHPSTDHDLQLATLRAAVELVPGACLRVVGCLDACQHSNVVVVRTPTVDGGRATRWFRHVLTDQDTATLAAWLGASGAGDDLPPELRDRVIQPNATAATAAAMRLSLPLHEGAADQSGRRRRRLVARPLEAEG